MTRQHFAAHIVDLVQQGLECEKSAQDIRDDVDNLLTCLSPENKAQFAQWGHAHERSTPEECWPAVENKTETLDHA
jgi:hypothetical protein